MSTEDEMRAVKDEIYSLCGETLALQALVQSLCSHLAAADAKMAALVGRAFDDAANFVEHFAIARGETASPKHTVHAIRVVEELRAVAIGDHQKPKHGI